MCTPSSKKCFDTNGLCYTRGALETFLPMRAPDQRSAGAGPDAVLLPPEKNVSPIACLLAVALVLGVVLGAGLPSARAEIIAYTDHGRTIYVNTEDEEMRRAVRRGGGPAAVQLLERRKRSLASIEEHIDNVATANGVDPRLVRAVIEVESGWNPRARSYKGAQGLMQLIPETGARFGLRDPYDPRQNITAGVRYLRFLLDRFNNNLELALAAYNAGENAVEDANGVPPYRETQQYLERIRTLYGQLGQEVVRGRGRILRMADEHGRDVYVNE